MTYPTSTRSPYTRYTPCLGIHGASLTTGVYAVPTQHRRNLGAPDPTVEVGMGSARIGGVSLRESLGFLGRKYTCHLPGPEACR